jgi:hypothetical protein
VNEISTAGLSPAPARRYTRRNESTFAWTIASAFD